MHALTTCWENQREKKEMRGGKVCLQVQQKQFDKKNIK